MQFRSSIVGVLAASLLVAVAAGSGWSQTVRDQDGDGVPDDLDLCVFVAPAPDPDAAPASDGEGAQTTPRMHDDEDKDGVGDECDACPRSAADLPVPGEQRRITNAKGCTLFQACPCAGPGPRTWRHRSAYLHCIRREVKRFTRGAGMTKLEGRFALRRARRSSCGGVRGRAGDMDGDGIPDTSDNCMRRWNPRQKDMNGDGEGDRCDSDIDGDGVRNRLDKCPRVKDEQQLDDDDDGIGNACDKCPQEDSEGEGKGCD
jgi:hypothetical protein